MDWHRYSGYALLGVLIFRIYWGFVGSDTARFVSFVPSFTTLFSYLRGKGAANVVGHNPLGAISVVALIILLLTQVGLGLFAVDIDGIESGPLSHLVSFDTGRVLAERHEQMFAILQLLMTLHVAAVFFYLVVKRNDLITPMINGGRQTNQVASQSAAPLWRAIPGIAIAALVVWLVAR